MKREEYLREFFREYDTVSILSEKNGCRTVRARHKELERDIVLHSLPVYVEAYEILFGISAPELPLVYDSLTLEDGQIVLEEYIDGITVAQDMETGLYGYRKAAEIMSGICRAMHILHGRGIVHRDIKPENVMLDGKGRVVLIDFNASRRFSNSTRDTVIMGTVGYAAPEQLGITQSDARTDIYAAGIMLNEMITGRHPCEQTAKGRAGRIVKKCTQLNPQDRFSSARELARAL